MKWSYISLLMILLFPVFIYAQEKKEANLEKLGVDYNLNEKSNPMLKDKQVIETKPAPNNRLSDKISNFPVKPKIGKDKIGVEVTVPVGKEKNEK